MLALTLQGAVTFQHWAGVRLYTTSLDFAESCVFSKQSPLALCLARSWHPFYLRYGAILPSSFEGVLSSPWYTLPTHWRQSRYGLMPAPLRGLASPDQTGTVGFLGAAAVAVHSDAAYGWQANATTHIDHTAIAVIVGAVSRSEPSLRSNPWVCGGQDCLPYVTHTSINTLGAT